MAILTKEDKNSAYHRVALMGLSGTGKTTLYAKLAEEFNITVLDLENGKDTFTKLPEEWLSRVNYIQLPDSATYPIAVETLERLFKFGKFKICSLHGKHECAVCKKNLDASWEELDCSKLTDKDILIIDSGTQLSHSILASLLRDKDLTYKPERDDWGGLRRVSEFFISQVQAFPKNLIITFHCIEAVLDDGKTKLVPSFGSKDYSTKIAKAFSDVIYTDVRNKKHVAYSSSAALPSVMTKSRSDFEIENMEIASLIPLFKNSHESSRIKVEVKTEVKTESKVESKANSLLANLKAKQPNSGV